MPYSSASRPIESSGSSTAPRHALVTGGTSGIGLGLVDALLEDGYRVSVNGLLPDGDVDRFLAQRSGGPQRIRFAPADLARPEQIEGCVVAARKAFGPISILVNCAGVQHVAPVEEFSTQRWDLILAVNLSAAFHTTRLCLPDMKASGWGRIVNVASAHALVASPYKAAYVAAKHGLLGLTKTVALEAAPHGVTCAAICPGYVRTPLVEKQIPDTAKARGMTEQEVVEKVLLAAQPTGRFVTIEELAEALRFLVGPGGTSLTGSALTLDGGWTAQ